METTKKKQSARQYLVQCRRALESAEAAGDPRETALARAELAYAHFQVREYKEGLAEFDGALDVARDLDDVELNAHCLGRKVLALQTAGRLPEAYETAGEILALGETAGEVGLQSDALVSQGQTLLESGEPMIALEKLQDAHELATATGDLRREMNALGVMGHMSLATAAADRAEAYFGKALSLAREVGDEQAEFGYLGNLAMVMAWQGKLTPAAAAYEEVLAHVEAEGNHEAAIHALHQLIELHDKLGASDRVESLARKGIELSRDAYPEEMFAFYDALILTYYSTGRRREADRETEVALSLARRDGVHEREVSFLLSLGESYLLAGAPERAVNAYEEALAGAVRLSRRQDEAYLTGRIGVALAEAGRVDEALAHHERALELARQREIPELEAEQLSMMAIAHVDLARRSGTVNGATAARQSHLDRARAYAESSLEIFARTEQSERVARARRLLDDISTVTQ